MSTSRATPSNAGDTAHGDARAPHPADEVHSISTVQESLAADQARRTRVYFIQMSIRVVCFLGAVAAQGWLRWALVAAAIVLPYSAVIFANAGKDRREYDASLLTERPPAAITALPGTPSDDEPVAPAADAREDASPDQDGTVRAGDPSGVGRETDGPARVIEHVDEPDEER
ncbi:DUF3099 domain-containing protein [Antribacter sp. KLBMP9083]|uniref:DUF3099 domain-containing protein n=1 Tax=Antribacter soli TaxID=2910976 RepID=A0AA41U7K4_9MICO|nr:DUF3099 domain-containing protein [Antribacter soli]MCF4121470.1 DUF3099 domain-containing protein [Antribacter soli]